MEYIVSMNKIAEELGLKTINLTCLRRNNKEVRDLIEKYFEDTNRAQYRIKKDNLKRLRDIVEYKNKYYVGTLVSLAKRLCISDSTLVLEMLDKYNIEYEIENISYKGRTKVVVHILEENIEKYKSCLDK